MSKIFDRFLETTLNELQKRAGHTQSSNQLLEAELDATRISLTTLKDERVRLIDEKENLALTHKKILDVRVKF